MPDEKVVGAGGTTGEDAYDAMSKAWVESEEGATPPVAAATPPAEPPKSAEPPAAVVTPPAEPAAPEPAAVVATPPATPPVDTPEARIAALEAENARLKAPAPAPAPVAATPTPAPTPAPEPAPEFKAYEYDETEKGAIAKFEKDWPEIAAAHRAYVGKQIHDAVSHVFNQFNRVYGPVLQQIMAGQETLSDEQVLTFLRGQHSDYDTQVDAMIKWADTLTGVNGIGAKTIIAEGTPQQVAELMTEFKKSTGVSTPAATPTPATPAAPAATAPKAPVVQISEAARKAAEKLAPTSAKRSQVAGTVDKNDFDGAWAEAMAEEQAAAK